MNESVKYEVMFIGCIFFWIAYFFNAFSFCNIEIQKNITFH